MERREWRLSPLLRPTPAPSEEVSTEERRRRRRSLAVLWRASAVADAADVEDGAAETRLPPKTSQGWKIINRINRIEIAKPIDSGVIG